MLYARIEAGVVAEIIEGTDVPIADRFHPDIVAGLVAVPDGVSAVAGWLWDGATFSAPVPTASPGPPSITARQLRLWLLSQGRALADVDAAIAALPAEQREPARVEWEYSTAYERDHPLIESIGDALGFTDEEITAGFVAAATL